MSTFHALTMPDGSMAIMQLVAGADLNEAIRKFSVANPAPVSVRAIDRADVPTDRTFRNAWRDTGTAIEHDMVACCAIHMARIRQARDTALDVLDVSYMRAIENGDTSEQRLIAATKQALRDLPATFDLTVAKTPDELKALWPAGLPHGRA